MRSGAVDVFGLAKLIVEVFPFDDMVGFDRPGKVLQKAYPNVLNMALIVEAVDNAASGYRIPGIEVFSLYVEHIFAVAVADRSDAAKKLFARQFEPFGNIQ